MQPLRAGFSEERVDVRESVMLGLLSLMVFHVV